MDKKRNKHRPILYDSIIKARKDEKITLRVEVSSTSDGPIPRSGLLIPYTYSVKQSTEHHPEQPVHFRLVVNGPVVCGQCRQTESIVCRQCRQTEYKRRYRRRPTDEQLATFDVPLVDFDAPETFIALERGSADVNIRFRCYPHHQSPPEMRFKYVFSTQLSACSLVSRAIAQLYREGKKITSHMIRSAFEFPCHAVWTVIPQSICHLDDADTLEGGRSMGVIVSLWRYHH